MTTAPDPNDPNPFPQPQPTPAVQQQEPSEPPVTEDLEPDEDNS